MRYAILVVWDNGSTDYLRLGHHADGTVAGFTKRAAEEQRDFMLQGMEDEVESISVVRYPGARGSQ